MVAAGAIGFVFAILGLISTVVVVGLVIVLVLKLDAIGEILGEQSESEPRKIGAENDPLETLRDRYARGELTDEEFERKAERLVDTEDAVGSERARELE